MASQSTAIDEVFLASVHVYSVALIFLTQKTEIDQDRRPSLTTNHISESRATSHSYYDGFIPLEDFHSMSTFIVLYL